MMGSSSTGSQASRGTPVAVANGEWQLRSMISVELLKIIVSFVFLESSDRVAFRRA